jgi:hypothetical protein
MLRRIAVPPVALVVAVDRMPAAALDRWARGHRALAIGTLMGAKVVIGLNLLWLLPLEAIGVPTALSLAFANAGLTPTRRRPTSSAGP